jgi:hypothetical protein
MNLAGIGYERSAGSAFFIPFFGTPGPRLMRYPGESGHSAVRELALNLELRVMLAVA